MGDIFAYVRISSWDQNENRQSNAVRELRIVPQLKDCFRRRYGPEVNGTSHEIGAWLHVGCRCFNRYILRLFCRRFLRLSGDTGSAAGQVQGQE